MKCFHSNCRYDGDEGCETRVKGLKTQSLLTLVYQWKGNTFSRIYSVFTSVRGCCLTDTQIYFTLLRDGAFLVATIADRRPWAGFLPSRVKPHQWSRSISAHWVSNHSSWCRKDSVRLMRGRQGDTLRSSLAADCLRVFVVFLASFGEFLHKLQLLHWFPLLIDGEELPERREIHLVFL